MSNTDFDPYQPDNIPLFEALYGKKLISLGGLIGGCAFSCLGPAIILL